MAVMAREAWTDERLDDFKENVNQRFDEVDKKIDNLDRRMEVGFAEMRREFAAQHRMMAQLFGGLFATMVVGFLGIIATVLTMN